MENQRRPTASRVGDLDGENQESFIGRGRRTNYVLDSDDVDNNG